MIDGDNLPAQIRSPHVRSDPRQPEKSIVLELRLAFPRGLPNTRRNVQRFVGALLTMPSQ